MLDEPRETPSVNYIAFDYRHALTEAVDKLLDMGHRHIVFAGIIPSANSKIQLETIQKCYTARNIDIEYIKSVINPGIYPAEASSRAMGGYIFREHPETTAIISTADSFAYGIMYAARKSGREIPQDLSVISCSDFSSSSYIEPALSVIHQPRFELGKRAAAIAQKMAEGISGEIFKEYVSTKFIDRQTTAKVNS